MFSNATSSPHPLLLDTTVIRVVKLMEPHVFW
jgi:hypothetical protein